MVELPVPPKETCSKQQENQNRMVDDFLKEIERREKELETQGASQSSGHHSGPGIIIYKDPRDHYLRRLNENLSEEER